MTMVDDFGDDDVDELPFKPLTKAEVQALRERHPLISPWRVIRLQMIVGLVMVVIVWMLTQRVAAVWSAAYGVLAVVVPGMLFARGLMSQFSSINAMTAGFGFFVWEAVKIGVSVAMLFAAPKLLVNLDWLAMLISLVVVMKVYWVALLMRPKLKQMKKN